MPIPKPLAEIKNDLQMLLVDDLEKTISTLQGMLPEESEKKRQTILLQGRLNTTDKDRRNQVALEDHLTIAYNQIRSALLDLIVDLAEKDFEPPAAGQGGQASVSAVPKFVIIYAEEDADYSKMLNKHLNVLKFTKKIRVYDVNKDVKAGEDVAARAAEEMADADYLVALITVDLMGSEWFGVLYDAIGEGRRIIPVRMEQADFEGTGLEKLRSLPSMNRAVSQFKSPDDAYMDIVTELRKLLPK